MTNVYGPLQVLGLPSRSSVVVKAAILIVTVLFCVSGPVGMAVAQDEAMDEFADIAGPGEEAAPPADAAAGGPAGGGGAFGGADAAGGGAGGGDASAPP